MKQQFYKKKCHIHYLDKLVHQPVLMLSAQNYFSIYTESWEMKNRFSLLPFQSPTITLESILTYSPTWSPTRITPSENRGD